MRKIKIITAWLLVLFWMGLIYYFSSMPAYESSTKSKATIHDTIEKVVNVTNDMGLTNYDFSEKNLNRWSNFLNKPLRKCMHLAIYFVLTILLVIAFNVSVKNKINIYIASFLFSTIYAISDEYHQAFVSGRFSSVKDLIIDMQGSLIGLFICIMISLIFRKIKRRKLTKSRNMS